jgi:hypothetical protein
VSIIWGHSVPEIALDSISRSVLLNNTTDTSEMLVSYHRLIQQENL